MGGITDIKAACRELGLNASGVVMNYDNVLGEQVFEFTVDGETIEVRAVDGMTPEQIVSIALAQLSPEEPLGLMSMPQIAPTIEGYDLVEDGKPMPKPALFFYDAPKKETK